MASGIKEAVVGAESHKGMKIKTYSMEFKLNAIKKAEDTSNRHAAEIFKVDPKRIREWRQKKEAIAKLTTQAKGKKRKALEVCGRFGYRGY